jgi:predicted dinucleotide-binding enzyme
VPPKTVKRGDHTAIVAQRQADEHQDEIRRRQEELTISAQQTAVDDGEVVDLTVPKEEIESEEGPEIVGEEDETFEIRINADIEGMTFGAGTLYDFQEGKRYRVGRALRDHLEEKELIWH